MKLIVAFSKNLGIGYKNKIPWNLKNDLKYFKKLTIGKGNNAVVMGKNTWKSLPIKSLPKRENLILSKKEKGENIFSNVDCLEKYCKEKQFDDIWVIGGEKIYKEFINNNKVKYIYTTEIDEEFKCDTFFPKLNDEYELICSKSNYDKNIKLNYNFNIYKNKKYIN